MTRISWSSYFLNIAHSIASRATCPRKSVGCVIVKDNRILATGYNGSMSGAPHCEDVGCLMVDNHCVRTVHAEVNAIAQAAREGVSLNGASVFVTCKPCWGCIKTMVNAGVRDVFYHESYGGEYPEALPRGFALVQL